MRFACSNGKLIPEPLLTTEKETLPISQIENLPRLSLNLDYPYNKNLQQILAGKQLLLEDLPFSLTSIQSHYENGYLYYRKSIVIEQNKPTCVRCGNQDPHLFAAFSCVRCREECIYCRKCIMMGRTSTCTPLVSWAGTRVLEPQQNQEVLSLMELNQQQGKETASSIEIKQRLLEANSDPVLTTNISSFLQWSGTLAAGQKFASDRVVEAVRQSDSLLVWAVCGAGKTEVLFKGINAALLEGKRVCLATPRTDVVLELAPRLKKVFPNIPVAALYGGSEDRHLFAPLTIATTHQLLRFYQAFDVLILDEVDAFPYSVDESLQYAVEQARKPNSSIVYLTATPNEKWQKECRTGKRPFVTIPARFHRYSLPVPQFVWCGNWGKKLKKGKLPPNILQWIQKRILIEKQALLFFPRIELMEKLLPLLQKIHPNIEAVHSEDPKRKEKVQAMRQKEIPLLLTTTILERGVTFPNIDVAVFGAEDRIFTESALVQIAGRVGRSSDHPSGDITFFHYGKTDNMVKARRQIILMNKEARQKGLIDD
ncbi:DEAD/DEAH box helicase [Bacillus sp. V3B]|uniref:DEAD/DEAH box helicase n=1 Tax=Bacillus sp. V3B TaxID=2804915 RepID=UPI00210AC47E|nr:DEAD/DEAH box helicase [Bacillus sp. V3B]MCQ6277124.1 DEAD/DEAH box helicase [Bacillus sp. V3B]